MLAPVAYPWPGGVGHYNRLVATPVIGPLLAYTVTLPLGLLLAEPASAACSCRRRCRMALSKTPQRRCCCARASSSPMRAIW